MNRKTRKIASIIVLVLGIFMIAYGIKRGEPSAILAKASVICTECIGLG